MAQEDVSTMRRAYEAFNRADIPAVLTAFDPNIAWHEPGGGNAPRGTYQGTDRVANEVFSTIPSTLTRFRRHRTSSLMLVTTWL